MATIEFSVRQLADAMDRATDEVKEDVARLIGSAAETTVQRLQRGYPQGPTGNLRKMVRVTSPRSFSTTSNGVALPAMQVKAFAPHVHIWQRGTKVRRNYSRGDANRGRMPVGGPLFEAIASVVRRLMLRDAEALISRQREL